MNRWFILTNCKKDTKKEEDELPNISNNQDADKMNKIGTMKISKEKTLKPIQKKKMLLKIIKITYSKAILDLNAKIKV